MFEGKSETVIDGLNTSARSDITKIYEAVQSMNIRLVRVETTVKAWLPIIAALCLAVGSIIGRVI